MGDAGGMKSSGSSEDEEQEEAGEAERSKNDVKSRNGLVWIKDELNAADITVLWPHQNMERVWLPVASRTWGSRRKQGLMSS